MMISEIAEFVGCDHRTVWSVIRNEDEDDLTEDRRYLNCEMGDIVDVDALGEIKPFIKNEVVDDDSMLLQSNYATGDGEYDSEAEIEDQCQFAVSFRSETGTHGMYRYTTAYGCATTTSRAAAIQ